MTPEEKLRFLILGAQREGNQMFRSLLLPLGATPSQAEVLRCLGTAGALSLRALGRRLVCESGSPSRLVSHMVDKGWVDRREDPADRRQIVLVLSETGRDLERQVRSVEEKLHGWIAGRLDADTLHGMSRGLETLLEGTESATALAERAKVSRPAD